MSLLAKSCLCPGLITVISNLITSSGDPPDPEALPYNWLHLYWTGQGFEIYKTQLHNFFRGKTFANSVLLIYKKFEAVLFGIELITDQNSRIFLNPGDMQLPLHPNTKIMGYIISQDRSVADDIAVYKVDETPNPKVSYGYHSSSTMRLINSSTRVQGASQSLFDKMTNFFKPQSPDTVVDGEEELKLPLSKRHKKQAVNLSNSKGGWIKMKSFHPTQYN